MSSLRERLEEVMAAKKWTRSDLLRITGQSQSLVSQWLGKGSKEINEMHKLGAAVALARESGYSALWIAIGEGPKFVRDVEDARLVGQSATQKQDLGAALTLLAGAVAHRTRVERAQLAALLRMLAEEPDDREETCAAVMACLEPKSYFRYLQTWEETARSVALRLNPEWLGTGQDFVDLVDEMRAKGEGGMLAEVPKLPDLTRKAK
ncbi:hypothetical protein [Ideonella livida]|uniref:HTH cro/C1-type domain-containing protein n=1 Tax=Ideonella livida TaxID=2707176 RepID=A0A7C9THM9_9BURK|nr:hypothetical protein [Ideonella livida]NDY89762.1 hypothetical protein [Ideonella livida]